MAYIREFYFSSVGGNETCCAKEWTPEGGGTRAVLQIVHGVAEHMGRYDRFARFMADRGFLVVGADLPGHGKTVTDGKFGCIKGPDGWGRMTGNIRKLREMTTEVHPNLPYFLMGHSMGSFLVRTYLIDWPGTVDGAILSGTGQENAFSVALGSFLSRLECLRLGPDGKSKLLDKLSLGAYNKQFAPNRTSCDWISSVPGEVDAYLADPMCGFSSSAGMFGEMMRGLGYIADRENLQKMDTGTPVYFFSGGSDPVGASGAGVKKVFSYFKNAGCTDLERKLYPGGRHEMLNESNRAEVLADLLNWLERHLSGTGENNETTLHNSELLGV